MSVNFDWLSMHLHNVIKLSRVKRTKIESFVVDRQKQALYSQYLCTYIAVAIRNYTYTPTFMYQSFHLYFTVYTEIDPHLFNHKPVLIPIISFMLP